MSERRYSPADIEIGIHLALEAEDMEAVAGLMHLLAAADPHRAQAVLDIVQIARLLNGAHPAGSEETS